MYKNYEMIGNTFFCIKYLVGNAKQKGFLKVVEEMRAIKVIFLLNLT